MPKKSKPKKVSGKSENPQEEKISWLKKQMPEVFREGKVDCDALRQSLGEDVERESERSKKEKKIIR